jgi:hypothetical protein
MEWGIGTSGDAVSPHTVRYFKGTHGSIQYVCISKLAEKEGKQLAVPAIDGTYTQASTVCPCTDKCK